jgi:hypothetical protein
MWSRRADAGIEHVSPPWAAMLAGISPDSAIRNNELGIANYFRSKGLQVVITIDATDGLNRAAEAPELVSARRSITETAIQQLYRNYVKALVRLVQPDYLGLAAETNLIRLAAPRPVYDALVRMTNDAATDVRAISATTPLYVSVQVETAWGKLPGGAYVGVEDDFRDFPFMAAMGLSSYPYLAGFLTPEDIPLDYYARLRGSRPTLPLLVVEGGWTSISLGGITSSPAAQARYVAQQAKMLDGASAIAYFQLSFTDLDLSSFPPQPPGSILPLFASLGLVDTNLQPKLALATWDSLFSRPRK